jgi:CDP-diacylglycerol--glycerol-3-phosphate 3-phosphatidyltransferase
MIARSTRMNTLMTNETVRVYPHDRLLARTILRLIPRGLRPNHFTVFRTFLIPFILFFVWHEMWHVAVPLFLFAAFTDVLDGSLARTRKQITLWGTMADPIADKLLIGAVVVLFVAREINVTFAIVIVFIECLTAGSAFIRLMRGGEIVSANWYGKVKMLLQVIGVTGLLIARWFGLELFVDFSIGTLSIAIVFALISLYTYGL